MRISRARLESLIRDWTIFDDLHLAEGMLSSSRSKSRAEVNTVIVPTWILCKLCVRWVSNFPDRSPEEGVFVWLVSLNKKSRCGFNKRGCGHLT